MLEAQQRFEIKMGQSLKDEYYSGPRVLAMQNAEGGAGPVGRVCGAGITMSFLGIVDAFRSCLDDIKGIMPRFTNLLEKNSITVENHRILKHKASRPNAVEKTFYDY
jgi:hypothetical protein